MATVEILTIPLGSQLTSTIGANDKENKNDFPVLLLWGENVDLTQSGISVSAGSSIVAFEGANSVYMVRVRPPQTAGTVTVTVAANAVAEGNAETSKDIEVVTDYPATDAETPTLLFNHSNLTNASGLTVSPTRIIAIRGGDTTASVVFFTHAGVQQTTETLTPSIVGTAERIEYFNDTLLIAGNQIYRGPGRFSLTDLSEIERYAIPSTSGFIVHTRLGVIGIDNTRVFYIQPYGTTAHDDRVEHQLPTEFGYRNIAHQDDLLYMADRGSGTNIFALAEINDADGATYVSQLNINRPSGGMRDIAIYRDTLYILGVNNGNIYTIDIRKYRPVAKRTKTTIYPQFVEAGGRLDLTQFSPDAERFTFDVGFDKPPHLSINTSNELVVGSGPTVLVKLKAINRIDATETESFGFYLIIRRATAPVWRNVSELTMRAGSSYDLFQLVDADSIAFRSGRPRPIGSSIANGVFTVGTVGGRAEFTARKGSRSSHNRVHIDVVQGVGNRNSLLQKNGVFRYRVEIAGIDVTSDLVGSPSVSETLDPVIINEYRVNDAAITLRNEGGKYNSTLVGNFWETNGLNAGGFQNAVKIYTEHFDGNGNWIENLLFLGLILESFEPISDATFKMSCVDISSRLRKALAQDFGTLEKWDSLRKLSDEDSFEGTYIPERSLLPMQVGTGIARSDRTDLAISRLELPSEGPAEQNTAYMTPMELKTAGGFLDANPLLRFKTDHRSEDVRFLINQLATNKEVYNTEIDIPGVTVDTPFLLNRGSVAFSVGSPTRTTRLPADWVYDGQGTGTLPNRVLILLSNPERHISDLLVQYDVQADSYRVLHTFDKDTAVHRIERRNSTNYYILTSAKIQQDRSAGGPLPRPNDSTGYASDSVSEGSEIKIYRYSTSSGTLTEHVSADDTLPPQLGIQYHVGFENSLYVDEFEGIRPDYRGAFKWNGSYLYYRYAKDGEFGVARVNTGGTTTKMIGQAVGKSQNHLNFAFDINSSGSIYFVYATVGVPSDVTVVDNQALGPGGSITLANNLSQNSTPFRLRLETPGSNYSGAPSVTIVGIDTSGESQSVTVTFTRPGQTRELTQTFLEITSISASRSWVRGNLIVTAIFQEVASQLIIERRTSGGVISTVFSDTQALSTLTDLDDTGGAYLGCHECVFHNNHLYILAPIQRVDVDGSEVSRSRTKAAGMVLYRCNVTAGSPSLTAIDTWDFVHQSGCNLTVHDGAVHFTEQPSAATRFKPYNPDLDGYWTDDERKETMGYNVIEESLGALKKINSSGEVESLGNVWYTDRPFNVFPTRMLSIEDDASSVRRLRES